MNGLGEYVSFTERQRRRLLLTPGTVRELRTNPVGPPCPRTRSPRFGCAPPGEHAVLIIQRARACDYHTSPCRCLLMIPAPRPLSRTCTHDEKRLVTLYVLAGSTRVPSAIPSFPLLLLLLLLLRFLRLLFVRVSLDSYNKYRVKMHCAFESLSYPHYTYGSHVSFTPTVRGDSAAPTHYRRVRNEIINPARGTSSFSLLLNYTRGADALGA